LASHLSAGPLIWPTQTWPWRAVAADRAELCRWQTWTINAHIPRQTVAMSPGPGSCVR